MFPRLWPLEAANNLLVAQRRKRIDEAHRLDMLALVAEMNVVIDTETAALAWFDISSLAQRHNLTVYDASSLELASRLRIPLATLDKRLAAAARVARDFRYSPIEPIRASRFRRLGVCLYAEDEII